MYKISIELVSRMTAQEIGVTSMKRKNAGLKRIHPVSDLTLRVKRLETKDNRSHRNRTTEEERVDCCAGL